MTRKGSDPVINSDMTIELQSARAEVWRKLLWECEPGVGNRYGATLQSLLKRRFGEHDVTDLAREIESLERAPSTSSSPVISSVMPSSTELCLEAWHTKV